MKMPHQWTWTFQVAPLLVVFRQRCAYCDAIARSTFLIQHTHSQPTKGARSTVTTGNYMYLSCCLRNLVIHHHLVNTIYKTVRPHFLQRQITLDYTSIQITYGRHLHARNFMASTSSKAAAKPSDSKVISTEALVNEKP